jgi:hypothetical protein
MMGKLSPAMAYGNGVFTMKKNPILPHLLFSRRRGVAFLDILK